MTGTVASTRTLWNEDPTDGIDNDLDGRLDEDGPDPQQDNDGDDRSQLVPPGLYVYRFTAFSDSENETQLGVVAVAY